MQTSFPAVLMRGGTSKGLFIHAEDLPGSQEIRDRVLLAAMGSPDMRQIDGLGGAHPLTSKVAILSKPTREDADIDYLFLQVAVDKAEVSSAQNCGNMLAGVGPWAIERGWVEAPHSETQVRIHMLNTGGMAVAHVPTANGSVIWSGDTAISGVPGTAAGIAIDFLDIAGSSTGALFPTGSKSDVSNGIEVTCIDNGMPVILIRATDLSLTGYEAPADLESNVQLKATIEAIRLEMAAKMNLGDVRGKTVPKISLLAPPQSGGLVMTRTFIPHRVHQAIGVLGAVSVATGCLIDGTVGEEFASPCQRASHSERYSVEHPTGNFEVDLRLDGEKVVRSALVRTARKLMSGDVFVPASEWGNG
ncbi:MAG: 4-oxalomesaconate tautomerase [Pseudomonadota bacterium]